MQRHQQGQPTPFHPSNARNADENGRNGVIEVWDAPGGYVDDYRNDMLRSLMQGHEIRVRGACRSACAQIIGETFRPFIRTDANPNGQIDIQRAGFDAHQASDNYGRKNMAATQAYLSNFPQAALDAARVPSAQDIGNEYWPVRAQDVLRAIEQEQRTGQVPVMPRRP